ncbi:cellulose synthase/poly-beta-1,6-N-acetylglucosamine synthase-like glycosyltransferase [Arcticibacter tournemirensis]|uniref:Glycosyltransferase n=1 Tax=Arcticibacter tournemirensis TaxID=699437 RepID=A0A5M9HIQ4_9SPHI|nr:glycosyltransferase family 2 protein [Arcticibacter tournemirensis]KAA8485294.1 glycosyltransferase [Arcticibacter tournemirensis]TQM50422.1 cellulose synthase/poly-beta-1,6-N-acetylglucosamine synthase-like glycosyltransferase [Arcticibacter tournemirensis]
MKQEPDPVKSPSKREKFTLRLMIFLGLISMGFFFRSLFDPSVISNPFLYWMLAIGLIFNCLTVLHEWYHYYSIVVPETPPKTKVYTVDIFTTFCAGEPYEMIEETLVAIQAIKYPHKTYLCDEANDPYLIDLCKRLGVNHVTRTVKINAKAGNINNALKQSDGELCVVLDPDHVPFPGFLDPIVSHFNNQEVGFVQIVQAYKNYNHGLIAKGAAQQTFQFYGPMMMTMNSYGTVQAIGANCTFRRTALESIGGHAAGLAEDMHTAMQLHARGWKSVYVPAVLARGLVPTTLSAYYSQQLKWSRGVFELLVATYPKLFRKFTWRQKLHYFTIPFHYLSGLIFLMNFLVPIIALTFSISPVNLDLRDFCFIGLPLLTAIVLIRHFVQWWVMEDEERGFHVVGGLLMIGTWWIYILGLFYTIVRKKVPYNPTPKDGNEANNWPLNIPNLCVIGLSLIAIVYGLYNDYNPYNLAMAGFALINCFIMFFNIIASRQVQFRHIRKYHPYLDRVMYQVHLLKSVFWVMRRRIYSGIRSTALLITILATCIILYFLNTGHPEREYGFKGLKPADLLYGIYYPQGTNGISSVRRVKQYQEQYHHGAFDIISLYISWGDQKQSYLPEATIDSIYNNGSIPMITWEPWQTLFDHNAASHESDKENKVFSRILHGDYDQYIHKFSMQLKALNRPVYLRFAHEADNPFYPWSVTGGNTASEFKDAWKYVHNYFSKNHIYNVIWVWNPWKPGAVNAFFPGKQYVDWIGVTNLNYGKKAGGKGWFTMEDMYAQFHNSPVFRSGVPVMLAEMGSSRTADRQSEWFKKALNSIKAKFPEIRALVLFNNKSDLNIPSGSNSGKIDWTISDPNALKELLHRDGESNMQVSALSSVPVRRNRVRDLNNAGFFRGVKGVNYTKGTSWHKSHSPFRKKELIHDFKEIKQCGLNAIMYYGPSIYDRNILSAAGELDINIQYGFWISDQFDFVQDKKQLDKLSKDILSTVSDLKSNPNIISWKIGNPVLQRLAVHYYKPMLIYQQEAYLTWIGKLMQAMKKEDPSRIISLEMEVSPDLPSVIEMTESYVPFVDSYGLILPDITTNNSDDIVKQLHVPYYLSKANVNSYLAQEQETTGFFISSWQDEETSDRALFSGLKDLPGRNKPELYRLKNHLLGSAIPGMPLIKILRPAGATDVRSMRTYHAVVFINNKWKLSSELPEWKYEWRLVKNNKYREPVSVKYLGEGNFIRISIPENPEFYKLHLSAYRDGKVVTVSSPLNTPLYEMMNELKF